MVKHISKIIKKTELYKELERRKIASLDEFLPGVSGIESDSDFVILQAKLTDFKDVDKSEHKKSVKKPRIEE